jgi:hypothetical protein
MRPGVLEERSRIFRVEFHLEVSCKKVDREAPKRVSDPLDENDQTLLWSNEGSCHRNLSLPLQSRFVKMGTADA